MQFVLHKRRLTLPRKDVVMQDDCVFCNRANIEENIITETPDHYVAASLGQITDGGYVLIIPKDHVPRLADLSYARANVFTALTYSVSQAISQEYRTGRAPAPITAFEHGIAGQTIPHAHLHIVPARLDFASIITRDFPEARIEGVEFSWNWQWRYAMGGRLPYLFWRIGRQAFVCWAPKASAQYLRVAAAALLGRPERGDWRQMDANLDRALREDTVKRLAPYFS